MGRMKTGIVSYTNNTNNSSGGNSSELKSQLKNLNGKIVAARVTDIVLDENHDKFSNVGQWSGIGAIYFEFVNQSGTGTNVNYALPYDSQLKTYPLVNEIVLLISLPNKNMGKQTSSESYFYLKPLGIWNHPHHDAYPNIFDEVAKKRLKNNNPTILIPPVNDGIDNTIELNSPTNISQNTFVEKENIKPLIPFMGDSLMEGRYGQSIRFGSTAKSLSQYRNNWSESGDNGDPILIIRNGQPEKLKDDRGWIPITEDLNKDLSSIYLTSYQKIPFSIANEDFFAYEKNNTPEKPSVFTSPQIILNSNRVVLNAKTDSILISGQKSVGLSSNKSINLEASQIYIDGSDIRLGSKDAEEPVLLGNKTITTLRQITSLLKSITMVLQLDQLFPAGIPIPNGPANTIALTANQILSNIETSLDSLASKKVKTK
jgi:hypothetical protein